MFRKHDRRVFIIHKHRGVDPGCKFDDSYLAAIVSDSLPSVWIPIVDLEIHFLCLWVCVEEIMS